MPYHTEAINLKAYCLRNISENKEECNSMLIDLIKVFKFNY